MEDIALLEQYGRNGSEDAFRIIVERNVNLVYSAAIRQTGNPTQAEEITQVVFIILARKAGSLGQAVCLTGWLYNTTRLTAANALRAEFRRARREQEAYMRSLVNESEPDVWTQIAPLLENAMGDLNQKERDAIVLRFFQGRTMQEVGRAFGGSENAAKKRLQRALEKLRNYFAKHKIILTTAIIAGAVSANSVQAAPAALAASATAMAVKSAAASGSTLTLIKGVLKIMAWTKAKTAFVTSAAILLGTAGATTVTVKAISHYREDAIWKHITRIDSRQLDAAPPGVAIRRAPSNSPLRGGSVSSGRGKRMGFSAPTASLLSEAYDISPFRIADTASFPAGEYDYIVSLSDHQSEALQAKIREKLGLAAKREMRDADVLVLSAERKNALGLRTATSRSGGGSSSRAGSVSCQSIRISTLANFLEYRFKVPVIDQTGLTERYDIDLNWNEPGGYQHPNPEGLKQALVDQLGLRLTPATENIEMLVVEKAK